MHRMHEFPEWSVKPPLEGLSDELAQIAETELTELLNSSSDS
jgi:hypothetical protein